MLERTTLSDHEIWLQTIEAGLATTPGAVPLLFERAKTLDAMGRDAEAEAGYRNVLSIATKHFGAWNDLGMLIARRGNYEEAYTCFLNAVDAKPSDPIGHANLGYILLRGGDHAGAKISYQRSLELHPQNVEAHRGLTIALTALGEESHEHRTQGFERSPLTTLPFRGSGAGLPILLLVSETSANVPLERLINTRTFVIHKIIVEFAHNLTTLPEHALIVNAVGDVDASSNALIAAKALIERSSAPVLNHPDAVELTSRLNNSVRLAQIPGVRTARVCLVHRDLLLAADAELHIASLQLEFPLLLRSLGYHTGEHFVRVNKSSELSAIAATLPGEQLLAMEYLDVPNLNGTFTKYRMMIVGDAMYPLHAAISHDWKVHYFSAAMSDDSIHREIDAAFLERPFDLIGQSAISCLAEVAAVLGLDYAGIDFAIDGLGNVVVFEANATMVVARPSAEAIWDYRRAPVEHIDNAVTRLLLEKSKTFVAV